VTGDEGSLAVKVMTTDSPGVMLEGAPVIARATADETKSERLRIALKNILNVVCR